MLLKLISNKYWLCLAFACLGLIASAQSAQSAFNSSAKEYISGNKAMAKQIALAALEQFPNDPKLNQLLKKMEDEENQDQQNQNQDQENQDNQDKKDDQQNQQNQENQDQENQDDPNNKPDDGDKKDQEEKQGEQPKPQAGKISREDAERLLEALSKEEQDVQQKVNEEKIKGKPVRTEKDW